jgi:hypothetical protein
MIRAIGTVHTPRAGCQSVYHYDSQAGERHQQNEQHRDHGDQAREWADLRAGDFRQRAAAMADGSDQHREILHASGQHRAHQQP